MTLADAALEYLRAGDHILAVRGKRPHPTYHPHWSWEDAIRGEPTDASDIEAVRLIFEDPTVTGIAILVPRHQLVADIDSEEAARLFMNLVGELPDTRISMSHHGLHIWFLAPGADRNYWLDGQTLLLKGFGGYVLAPPSAFAPCEEDPCPKWHSPYDVYTWVDNDFGLDWLPDGLKARLKLQSDSLVIHKAVTRDADEFKAWRIDTEGPGFRAYRTTIDGLAEFVRKAPEGNRNNILAWAALTAAEEGVSLPAMQPLSAAAIAAGLPQEEAERTVRAAYRRVARRA